MKIVKDIVWTHLIQMAGYMARLRLHRVHRVLLDLRKDRIGVAFSILVALVAHLNLTNSTGVRMKKFISVWVLTLQDLRSHVFRSDYMFSTT